MRILALLLLLAPATPSALAQNTGALAGTVTDDRGEPLPGATVFLTRIQRGAATDMDGRYTVLSIPVGVYEVQVSSTGFQFRREPAVRVSGGQAMRLDVALAPAKSLAEVVVVYERPCAECVRSESIWEDDAGEIWNLPVRGPRPFPGAPPWPPAPRQ